MRGRRDIKFLLALCAFSLSQGVARAAPIDSLLAAIATEEIAPAVRVRLFVRRGDIADVYYIDRIRPGRLRVLKNPRQNGLEMIVIGNRQWLRTASGWKAAPALAGSTGEAAPSLTALLKNGLTSAVEQADADGSRIIEGQITWSASTMCKGKLRVHIEPSGRPFFLGFEGECASKPTVFRQAMSYDGGFSIEPPN
ncbi:MAG: hypothetical protein ABI885_29595 [Gammaproteobacteria bacterium]